MRLFYIFILIIYFSSIGICEENNHLDSKNKGKTLSFKIYQDSCPPEKKLITDCYWIKWDNDNKPWYRGLPIDSNNFEDGYPLQSNILKELLKKYGIKENLKKNKLKHSFYADLFSKKESELYELLLLRKDAQLQVNTCENVTKCRNVTFDVIPDIQAIQNLYETTKQQVVPSEKTVEEDTTKMSPPPVKVVYSAEIISEFEALNKQFHDLYAQFFSLKKNYISKDDLKYAFNNYEQAITEKLKNNNSINFVGNNRKLIETRTEIFFILLGVVLFISVFLSYIFVRVKLSPYSNNINEINNYLSLLKEELEKTKDDHIDVYSKLDNLTSDTKNNLQTLNSKMLDFSKRQENESKNLSDKLYLFEKEYNIGQQFLSILEKHLNINRLSTAQDNISTNSIDTVYDKKLITDRANILKDVFRQYSKLLSYAANSVYEEVRLFTQEYLLELLNKDINPILFTKFFSIVTAPPEDMLSRLKKGGEFDGLLKIYNLVHAGNIFKIYLCKKDIVSLEFLAAQTLLEEYANILRVSLNQSNVIIHDTDFGLIADNNYLNTKSIPQIMDTFFKNHKELAKDIFYNSFDEVDSNNDFIVYWVDFRFSSSGKIVQRGTVTKLSALKILRGDINV